MPTGAQINCFFQSKERGATNVLNLKSGDKQQQDEREF
jgi:hypothetical protein